MEGDTAEQTRPSFFSLLASVGWFPLLVLVLVVLFVVGLVGTTAYLLGKKSQVPKMPVEQTAAPEQNGLSQPTPSSTKAGTATLPSPTPPRRSFYADYAAIHNLVLTSPRWDRYKTLSKPCEFYESIVDKIDIDGDWATVQVFFMDPTTRQVVPTEPILILAHRTNSGWQIAHKGSELFKTWLDLIPSSVIPDDVKPFLR